LHVAEPFPEGAAHALQEVPQVAGDVLETQAPEQLCCPVGHAQEGLVPQLPSRHW
jgi:hypothetical protein